LKRLNQECRVQLATDEQDVLRRLTAWTARHDAVRAVVLTSSRAVPDGPVDLLSDYDIALLVTDSEEFARSEDWVGEFGPPLLTVRDQTSEMGIAVRNCMVLYDDGTKVDYSIWPDSLPEQVERSGQLPPDFDLGYRVLLDKDGRAATLPPSHTAYLPAPPTEQEYQSLIQEFWFCATYVAKYLWRDELMPAKIILDYEMTYLIARRMLYWRIGLDHGWSVRPGFFGRGLRRHLDAAIWTELEGTFAGAEPAAIWTALDRAIALFRRVAISVGNDLGYAYPHDLDATMTTYLEQIKRLP
jgi:aminoglycoside 6-adenylyltransferase